MNLKPVRPQDTDAFLLLEAALEAIRIAKPNDRGAKDRCYAVAITDMEKVCAYFKTWILDRGPDDRGESENSAATR